MKRFAVVGVLALLGSLVGASPASAEPGPHCRESGYCLFSGARFSGTKAIVPAGWGCRPVEDLGFTPARSAARGSGIGTALQLFSDPTCTVLAATVYDEVPNVSAGFYRLMPIPAG